MKSVRFRAPPSRPSRSPRYPAWWPGQAKPDLPGHPRREQDEIVNSTTRVQSVLAGACASRCMHAHARSCVPEACGTSEIAQA
eukprot:1864164-Alexandrium_andersonii.AAC.1